MALSFDRVVGTDPSRGMVEQARSSTPSDSYPTVTYQVASAEDMPFLESQSVDIVVSGQAAHWFDPEPFFHEMERIIRKGGTLALWCYKDHVFVDFPTATQILNHYCYGESEDLLGPYWQQPGRKRVQNKLRDLRPPESAWTNVHRIEYEPSTNGPQTGEMTVLFDTSMIMGKRMTLADCMNYIRTWSSFNGWQEKHPEAKRREDGGSGDVVDRMFDEIIDSVWGSHKDTDCKNEEMNIEWGSGLVLARRK